MMPMGKVTGNNFIYVVKFGLRAPGHKADTMPYGFRAAMLPVAAASIIADEMNDFHTSSLSSDA